MSRRSRLVWDDSEGRYVSPYVGPIPRVLINGRWMPDYSKPGTYERVAAEHEEHEATFGPDRRD